MAAVKLAAAGKPCGGPVRALDFSHDGRLLASGSADKLVRLWRVPTARLEATLSGHRCPVWAVQFGRDDKYLASASADWTARVWPLKTKQIAGGRVQVCELWWGSPVASGKPVAVLSHGQWPKCAVAFNPLGRLVAYAGYDGVVRVWNIGTRKLVAELKGHEGTVNALAFSPDGKILASAGEDRTIRLWDTDNWSQAASLEHDDAVNAIAFMADGKLLVAGDDAGTVRIWSIAEGNYTQELSGHPAAVTAVAVRPDGKFVAAGLENGEIWIWNAETGEQVLTLCGLPGDEWVAWTPLNHFAASEGAGKYVVWRLDEGENRVRSRNLWFYKEALYRPDILQLTMKTGSPAEAADRAE